ncbi:pentapeptide repeat-containing protein [Actinoplanes italicus]|uniref:pentapeptide repeat-containing protein n=1 Tax=Actinoplanes italicus TaxID=113567 RepID=UPI001474813F|nr:pentapeptide repeat-containing protein [Actinoplanes italicus]
MSQTLQFEPALMGVRRYWLVRGEQTGGRFTIPDDNLDISLVGARLSGVDFSRIRFGGFLAHDSVFEGCDFSRTSFSKVQFGATGYDGTRWDEQRWPETVYRDCAFARTKIPARAFFGNARFERCVLDHAGQLGWRFSGQPAQFVDCTFRGRIKNCIFDGTVTGHSTALGRDRNAFTGNDFTGAELVDNVFRHIDLRAQIFPGPPGHALLDRFDERVEAVLAAYPDPPADHIWSGVVWWLRYRAEKAVEFNDGYAQVSPDSLGPWIPHDVGERLFHLLVAHGQVSRR